VPGDRELEAIEKVLSFIVEIDKLKEATKVLSGGEVQ
jgi:hypothetical protein